MLNIMLTVIAAWAVTLILCCGWPFLPQFFRAIRARFRSG